MAFEGTLEDLAIVDVLQLLNVSQKTGVLMVFQDALQAQIVLKEGRIVGCKHPECNRSIGQTLVQMNAVTEADIEQALQIQKEAADTRRPLMGTLVELGKITEDVGRKALESLIESTVVELVSWQRGSFVFELGEFDVGDDFAHVPPEVDSYLSIDTQTALMEAVRILDERNRAEQTANTTQGRSMEQQGAVLINEPVLAVENHESHRSTNVELPAGAALNDGGMSQAASEQMDALLGERLEGSWCHTETRRVILFSDDGLLKMSMRNACGEQGVSLFVTEVGKDVIDQISTWHQDMRPPVLVCDIAGKESRQQWHRDCMRTLNRSLGLSPDIPLILICDPTMDCFTEGFAMGATAMLPRPTMNGSRAGYVDEMRQLYNALVTCIDSVFKRRSQLEGSLDQARRRMRLLKRRIREVRFPEGPSEISLVVLRHVAEYVERCVLFLTRPSDLLALGAFGLDNAGETVCSAITRLRMPMDARSVVGQVVASGKFYCGDNNDPIIKKHLYDCIGAPANQEMVLVPLRTRDKTAAVIYGDFGREQTALVETDSLEILADHAGMAFELALAQRN